MPRFFKSLCLLDAILHNVKPEFLALEVSPYLRSTASWQKGLSQVANLSKGIFSSIKCEQWYLLHRVKGGLNEVIHVKCSALCLLLLLKLVLLNLE